MITRRSDRKLRAGAHFPADHGVADAVGRGRDHPGDRIDREQPLDGRSRGVKGVDPDDAQHAAAQEGDDGGQGAVAQAPNDAGGDRHKGVEHIEQADDPQTDAGGIQRSGVRGVKPQQRITEEVDQPGSRA